MAAKFTDKVKKAVKAAVEGGNVRPAQRTVALALGRGKKKFSREELWDAMVQFKLDEFATVVANLTQNMKKDNRYFTGDHKKGWKLTADGEKAAAKLVAAGTPATVAALRELFGGPKRKKAPKKKASSKKASSKTKASKRKRKRKTKKKTKAKATPPAPRKRKRRSKTAKALAESSAS